jgi:16S rRNA (guanine966-N2)-methyltransferase
MRIVAGKYRGRRLRSLRGLALRPTSDRLRETLFNILGPGVEDALFVDVFAGTGAGGIEALSRGARGAVFIEKHPAAIELIRSNLAALGIRTGAEILATDALRGLESLAARHLRASFFFLDPPYAAEQECQEALEWLGSSRLLEPAGRVVVEHSRRRELPDRFEDLERVRLLEQGDAALSFYRMAAAA